MKTAYVAFGSNLDSPTLGTSQAVIDQSIRRLDQTDCQLLAYAPLLKSPPWPPSDQPWYVNTVASFATSLTAQAMLDRLLTLEIELGRERSVPNAARIIDLDLIDFDGQCQAPDPAALKPLTLPHPRMHQRLFVLQPLAAIAPDWHHPRTNICIQDLIKALPDKEPLAEA